MIFDVISKQGTRNYNTRSQDALTNAICQKKILPIAIVTFHTPSTIAIDYAVRISLLAENIEHKTLQAIYSCV